MICKDCIHSEVCAADNKLMARVKEECQNFKDKSKYIELPCKVGEIHTGM